MYSLQKQFHDFIKHNQLVKKGGKILLAVSGGMDSMVLCHLFKAEKIEFAIAHCNFGLRGNESDGDEVFVIKWADRNGINCFVKSFDLKNGSIQLEARNARYQWFQELMDEIGFNKIATAHHLNDSLETLLINMTRGTGYRGISGIPLNTGNIIRPLLFAPRINLSTYATDQKISWREDSSNKKNKYDRNFIRHHVIPEFEKLNPSLLKSFSLTSERLRYGACIISEKINEVKSQHLYKEKSGGFRLELNWIRWNQDQLILAEILSEFGVNYVTAKEVYASIGHSGKTFPVKEWFITMDRHSLFFDKIETLSVQEMEVKNDGVYGIESGSLKIETMKRKDVVFGSADETYFDADKLRFPLKLRAWEAGDRFYPLGMIHQKKISDFLIDLKVPRNRKKQVSVIESNNQIAWVIGYRMSNLFKITDQTERILKITKMN